MGGLSGVSISDRRRLELLQDILDGEGGFAAWAEAYQERNEPFLEQVGSLIAEMEGRNTCLPNTSHTETVFRLRRARDELNKPFCLFLHASSLGEKVIEGLDPHQPGADREEMIGAITLPDTGWRMASAMSVLLDEAGIYCVTLSSPISEPAGGLLALNVEGDIEGMWFVAFTYLAELADAIIIHGGFGPYLQTELRWLDMVGIKNRAMVLTTSSKLIRFVDGKFWTMLEAVDAVSDTRSRPPSWEQADEALDAMEPLGT